MPFHLEALTVCVGYDDFLAETIRWNQGHFDRWLVVTRAADVATRELCRRHNLECLTTDEFGPPGEFNKGRGVMRGLDHLGQTGWLLHVDADVVLPPLTRQVLEAADLDPEAIYGCDRALARNWAEWERLRASGYLQHAYHYQTNFPPGLPLGTRWCSPRHGYVPIGFFQLWHGSAAAWRGIISRPYPRRHNTAARSDVQHALQWDRRRRHLLPELIAIHLESETAPLGANWTGRKTRRFGPPPAADQRADY